MASTLTLIDFAGAIALLLWGVHMVQTGVQRAFGAGLRRALGVALGSRSKAFLAGLAATAVLQSSTATGLMNSSFTAARLVDLVPALAAMLGANVGTTLIVQMLSFDVSRIASLGLLAGVMMFRRGGETRTRDLGRVLIGLGLMLLALRQLLELVTPYEDVPSLRLLLGSIATEPMIAVLLAALLTWAAHSSVAMVLLVMTLAAKGVVPPHAAFALVLGANLGTAINPLLEGAASDGGAGRRLPVGNLVNRLVGIGLALATLNWIGPWLVTIEPDPARALADFHTGFNLALALLFLPVLRPFAGLLRRWFPDRVNPADPPQPLFLAEAAREAPTIALAGAAREALRMADVLDRNVMALAAKRLKRGMAFMPHDRAELSRVFDRLAANLRTAGAVFMTEDGGAARTLAAEKEAFRVLESQATAAHFVGLRQGRATDAGNSSLYLDVLRDLKRVNTRLVAAAAYPVLEAGGALLPSRLRHNPDAL